MSPKSPADPATPTFATLERARVRQLRTLRRLRPLGLVVVAVVVVVGSMAHPQPGGQGDRLGVLLGLTGFAIGTLGVVRRGQESVAVQTAFSAVLIAGSATLVWLQPDGAGFLGFFVVVSTAAMRVRGRLGAAVAVAAAVALALARTAASHRSAEPIILSELGVIAFYTVAAFANRVREGQDQAERLLVQLEQTRAAQARAAALAERHRLAREMHDVLAHSLSGLTLQLEGARLLVAQGDTDPRVVDAVERAHHLAKAGLEEARRAISTLRDEELPGPDRLLVLATEFERDCGIRCESEVVGEERELGAQARLTLYRCAQEALTNVRKHARPQRVELHLGYEPTGVRLTIEDFTDTEGPAPVRHIEHGGYGLTGMRERAELIGGTLTAAPTGGGFRVELWIPK